MINTTEIRRGNLFIDKLTGRILVVDGITCGDIVFDFLDGIPVALPDGWQAEPILLTSDVLMKCGFIDPAENGLAYRINIDSTDELCWYMNLGFIRYQTQGSGFTRYLQHIKYLHQLQNWWYMHTNTELNFKP